MIQEIYQKQFTIGRIYSESWKILRENFKLLLIITLIIFFPINIIRSFIFIKNNNFIVNFGINMIIPFFNEVIYVMTIAYIIKNKIDGKFITIKEALKKSFSKFFVAIITIINQRILLVGLTLLFIIPGIIFYVYWQFAELVVILKDKSYPSALEYSREIVKGRWWSVFGYTIIFFIFESIALMITFLISLIFFMYLPKTFFINRILSDTFLDINYLIFIVPHTIFFINLDSTKKSNIVDYDANSLSPPQI